MLHRRTEIEKQYPRKNQFISPVKIFYEGERDVLTLCSGPMRYALGQGQLFMDETGALPRKEELGMELFSSPTKHWIYIASRGYDFRWKESMRMS